MELQRRIARAEPLKLAPLAAFGALAVPCAQSGLIDGGRELMSNAQSVLSPIRLAPAFTAADVTSLKHFLVSAYLTYDPGVDPADWRLKVHGAEPRHQVHACATARSGASRRSPGILASKVGP